MELSISGRSVRQTCQTIPSSRGLRVLAVPPLLKGHSITVQFRVVEPIDQIWVCFGTNDAVSSNAGLIATLGKSSGKITHMKPTTASNRVTYLPHQVARYDQDISQVIHFWIVWREGLFFVGCGNVGESLLMAADVASDEMSVGLDSKPDNNRRFVTDEVGAIFVGCGNWEDSEPSGRPVNWDIVIRALWRNSPCRYARALTTCDSALPEASPRDRLVRDKVLCRKLVKLVIPRLPSSISLSELCWWLRFAYKPTHGLLARKLASGAYSEIIGHNIDVESARFLSESGNNRKVEISARVTQEVLKNLLSFFHIIKDPELQIWILQE
jgi:hypothetical protein